MPVHRFGDIADSHNGTFMVRVQNQPVNPGVLVAPLAACSRAQRLGEIFPKRADEQKAASTQVGAASQYTLRLSSVIQ
jgi:hypothetical protein